MKKKAFCFLMTALFSLSSLQSASFADTVKVETNTDAPASTNTTVNVDQKPDVTTSTTTSTTSTAKVVPVVPVKKVYKKKVVTYKKPIRHRYITRYRKPVVKTYIRQPSTTVTTKVIIH